MRFIATRESLAPEMYKNALLQRLVNAMTRTDAFSGRAARALSNAISDGYAWAAACGEGHLPGSMRRMAWGVVPNPT
jgi:NAD(P)H-dependent flavin oxidoreductase YrpB (nitropropane dioxygenase family)